MTQGDTLDMIAYGIWILLLILKLCTTHPHVTQLRYADDVGAGGTFEALHDQTSDLLVRGPSRQYSPEPINIIMVVFLRNVQQVEEHFQGMGVQVFNGSR